MGKRVGFLMESIADPDNLRLAFWKAQKGKRYKQEVREYSSQLDKNLILLRNALLDGNVDVGNYHYFTIYDPKERIICAASFQERVLHHAIMNVCHQYFERWQIFDSYATRIGKGQYAALERAKSFTHKFKWFCKLDVRKYFDTIDHIVLYDKLQSKFKDDRLLFLFSKIIKSYSTTTLKGLPIGNLTSQYFANFYLSFADRFIKESLKAKAYVRYMDDMVIWGDDKGELIQITKHFEEFIKTTLHLELKPICLNNVSNGLPFLGYVLFPENIRLNKVSRKRFINKMNNYNSNLQKEKWSQADYANHVTPLISFTQYANSYNLRKQIMCKMEVG